MKTIKITGGTMTKGLVLTLPDRHANMLLRRKEAIVLVDCMGCEECTVSLPIAPPVEECAVLDEETVEFEEGEEEEELSPAVSTDINENDMGD